VNQAHGAIAWLARVRPAGKHGCHVSSRYPVAAAVVQEIEESAQKWTTRSIHGFLSSLGKANG
jgi:hypothetical protein